MSDSSTASALETEPETDSDAPNRMIPIPSSKPRSNARSLPRCLRSMGQRTRRTGQRLQLSLSVNNTLAKPFAIRCPCSPGP